MWQCLKCKREFQKVNQSHSCRPALPIEEHFKGKERARALFDYLKSRVEKNVGSFTIDSRHCCIHFVKVTTFCACWAMKDKIRIDFSLDKEIQIDRAHKMVKLSANRFIYYIDIETEDQIDRELLGWIGDSYGISK